MFVPVILYTQTGIHTKYRYQIGIADSGLNFSQYWTGKEIGGIDVTKINKRSLFGQSPAQYPSSAPEVSALPSVK